MLESSSSMHCLALGHAWLDVNTEKMKNNILYITIIIQSLMLTVLFCSCNRDINLYQPNQETEVKKDISKIFDFSTVKNVKVSINYGYTGYRIEFSVYFANPLNPANAKNNLPPIFAGVTDYNSSMTCELQMPAFTDTVFVCSNNIGVPQYLALPVVNGQAKYTYVTPTAPASSRSVTRLSSCINIGDRKTTLSAEKKIYGTYYNIINTTWGWDWNFVPEMYNVNGQSLYEIVDNNAALSSESYMGDFLSRINNTLRYENAQKTDKTDNSAYIRSAEHVNTVINENTNTGIPVSHAHVDLVFLNANGGFLNALGYYYYPTNMKNRITADYIKSLPIYCVFPKTTAKEMNSSSVPGLKLKTRLQFFGADYNSDGTDDFPPGYTIGYVLIPDLLNIQPGPALIPWAQSEYWKSYSYTQGFDMNAINSMIVNNISRGKAIYSNNIANHLSNVGCITCYDTKSQKIILGFEDESYLDKISGKVGDNSYEDMLFYIDADPIGAVIDSNRPAIDNSTQKIEDTSYSRYGTYAFEDIWPNGGDYDMNDVVVEWITNKTTNNSKVKKIEDKFKIVQKPGAAIQKNGIGFVINDSYGGTITCDSPDFTKEEDNQYIICADANAFMDKTITFTRTFAEGSYPIDNNNDRNYNIGEF